jgi:hypothetical protein
MKICVKPCGTGYRSRVFWKRMTRGIIGTKERNKDED